MTTYHVVAVLLLSSVVVMSSPVRDVKDTEKSRFSRVADISSKLSRLKSMLQDLEKDEETLINTAEQSQTGHIDPQPKVTSQLLNLKEPMAAKESEADSNDDVSDLAHFLKNLTPREISELKVLKALLENPKPEKKESLPLTTTTAPKEPPKIVFFNSPLPDDKLGASEGSWENLARDLQAERDGLYLNDVKSGNAKMNKKQTMHTDVKTYKDEVKASIEKNLLSDIALAIHSGISVDDIIKDFTFPDDK